MTNISSATRDVEKLKVRRNTAVRRERMELKAKMVMDELEGTFSKDWLKSTIMNVLGISDRHIVNSWIKYLDFTGRIVEIEKNKYKINRAILA